MKKQTDLRLGWFEGEYISANFHFGVNYFPLIIIISIIISSSSSSSSSSSIYLFVCLLIVIVFATHNQETNLNQKMCVNLSGANQRVCDNQIMNSYHMSAEGNMMNIQCPVGLTAEATCVDAGQEFTWDLR